MARIQWGISEREPSCLMCRQGRVDSPLSWMQRIFLTLLPMLLLMPLATPPMALAFVSPPAGDDPHFAAWAEHPPAQPPLDVPLFPLENVRPGMKVVGYTVFEGSKVEPFVGTVKGIAESFIGPQRDVVIVQFEEPRMKHVGIVHGMSGSPIYIGGRILGALSLALSPFPKDALGGVTPLAYMLDEAQDIGSAPLPSGTRTVPQDSSTPGLPPKKQGETLLPTREGWTATRSTLNTSGLPDSRASSLEAHSWPAYPVGGVQAALSADEDLAALQAHFQPALGAWGMPGRGLEWRAGGSTSWRAASASPEAVKAEAMRIQPGAAVAGVLVEGDLNLVATGTVTWRKGDDVWAFGHPFLQQGPLNIPMATAEVVTTVADQTYPYKLANRGTLVGAVTADRVTAIVGRIGPIPPMIPVSVQLDRASGLPGSSFQYRIADDRELASTLYQIVVANSFRKQWRYFSEGTYQIESTIRLKGGRRISTGGLFTFSNALGGSSLFTMIDALARPFGALMQNPFEPVVIEGVDIRASSVSLERLYYLEQVYVDSPTVAPGTTIPLQIGFRKYLGERSFARMEVPIPAGIPAGTSVEITLKVADAETLDKAAVSGQPDLSRAGDLQQLLDMLDPPRSNGRCYVQVLRKTPGVTLRHQQLTGLPGSVRKVLELASSSEVATTLEQSVLWEGSLPMDGMVVGSQELTLRVQGR